MESGGLDMMKVALLLSAIKINTMLASMKHECVVWIWKKLFNTIMTIMEMGMRVTDKYVFFFTDKDVFSNWYIAPFFDSNANKYNPEVSSSVKFDCVEQYMMWRKASLFKDYETASAILNGTHKRKGEKDQAYYKRMGRAVRGYDDALWKANREYIVKRGIFLKYTQMKSLTKNCLNIKVKHLLKLAPMMLFMVLRWECGMLA